MTPFNYEKAIKAGRAITKDGRIVTDLVDITSKENTSEFCLLGEIKNEGVFYWTKSGLFVPDAETSFDLVGIPDEALSNSINPNTEPEPNSTNDLTPIIKAFIINRAALEDFPISNETLEFMATSLSQFVHDAAAKFIAGGKEHGDDFLNSVDHLKEMKAEIYDFFWYSRGESVKKNTFDKRINQ